MPYLRLLAGLLVIGLAVGCNAQTNTPSNLPAPLQRRIEVMIRSQYDVPPDVNLAIGARQSSQFTGYETLPVILSKDGKTQELSFLISADEKKLVHLSTIDLTKDPAASIDISGRPIRGNPDAKVTIINFDDLECPFCARMHQELFPATLARYKNQVRFIYKDDPLTDLHPWAMHASVDANCLADQSGAVYWTYVDYLHAHGDEITGSDRNLQKSFAALDRIARQEGTVGKLDETKLNGCIAKQDETRIRASLKEADALGLDGTPELFVNGERINGAVPEDQLWAVIDRALRAQGETPPPMPPPPAKPMAGTTGARGN